MTSAGFVPPAIADDGNDPTNEKGSGDDEGDGDNGVNNVRFYGTFPNLEKFFIDFINAVRDKRCNDRFQKHFIETGEMFSINDLTKYKPEYIYETFKKAYERKIILLFRADSSKKAKNYDDNEEKPTKTFHEPSREQKRAVSEILHDSLSGDRNYVYYINGLTRTGKSFITYIFQSLSAHERSPLRFLYLVNTNVHCQDANFKRPNVSFHLNNMTFFAYLMKLFQSNFENISAILNNISTFDVDTFTLLDTDKDPAKLRSPFEDFINEYDAAPVQRRTALPLNKAKRVRHSGRGDCNVDESFEANETVTAREKWSKIIAKVIQLVRRKRCIKCVYVILDEIYMLHDGEISFFLYTIRLLQRLHNPIKIVPILLGDEGKIRPYIRHEEFDKTPFNNTKKAKMFSPSCANVCHDAEYTLHSNWRVFEFINQNRTPCEKYHELLRDAATMDETPENGKIIFDKMKTQLSESFKHNINIEYPLEKILDLEKTFNTIIQYIKENYEYFFEETLNINLFCLTCKHAHLYNLLLALSIRRQLEMQLGDINKPPPDRYVIYVAFFLNNQYDSLEREKGFTELFEESERLNVLPLIRYYPYKILGFGNIPKATAPCARLSVVYLIDWCRKDDCVLYLVLYSCDRQRIFKLYPCRFQMNLYKNEDLFGFPLELAFGSTFASSQSLMLKNKIAISMHNILAKELYVVMSRITTVDNIEAFY